MAGFGLSNAQALSAVSASGFHATARAAEFEVSAPADAGFFGSNPLEDLTALCRPAAVLRLGEVK